MGKINGCLKCFFIFFNVLFAIFGCLLIYGAAKTSHASGQLSSVGTPGVGWVWVWAIGILGISCLGIYAGQSEKQLVLKVFAGFMVAGMIIMLICGIYVAVMRNQLKDVFTTVGSDTSKTLMQTEGFAAMMNDVQTTLHCCGLSSAEDWGSEIPYSCSCRGSSSGGYGRFGSYERSSGCKARPTGTTGPAQIYSSTCGGYIFDLIDVYIKVTMGFCFGFAVTAFLGLLVTLLMLHQIKHYDGEGPDISMMNY